MAKIKDCKLVLSSGEVFEGISFGAREERVFELVFNTSMAGYQDIISDPTYYGQGVVMTYPVIGSYGIAEEDFEVKSLTVGALIVRDYTDSPSNFLCTKTLEEVLEDGRIPAIYGVDTRKLSKIIRDGGTQLAIITDICTPIDECMEKIKNHTPAVDAVAKVSCRKRWYSRTAHAHYTVALIDCGVKSSMIKCLNGRGCNVIALPYSTTAEELEHLEVDGVIISNGPGCAKDVKEPIELIKNVKGKYPLYGIGLGHQLVALAYGGDVYKLKFGHRGANHPVNRIKDGKIDITCQNHGYAVDEASLKKSGLIVTHKNLLDGTIEAMECEKDGVITSQYYNDNAPGPHDGALPFEKLITMMEERKNA